MTFLNAQQIAFLLGVKKQDARAKMIHAYCADKGWIVPANLYDEDGKLDESKSTYIFPETMAISVLSKGLNIPDLQTSVDDIQNNYLTRAATKRWILCDFPEKQIAKMKENGDKKRIRIPAALKSMLPIATVQVIEEEWAKGFPAYNALVTPAQ